MDNFNKPQSPSSSSSESSDESSSSDDENTPSELEFSENEDKTSTNSEVTKTPRYNNDPLQLDKLPPIENLKISVEENECIAVGKVFSIVDRLLVIESLPDTPPLMLDSVIFNQLGKPIGQIFDVFGHIKRPFYSIRFNKHDDISSAGLEIEKVVYCAPKTEHTKYIFTNDLLREKGSDASWFYDEEPPPNCIDYSDDEKEREAKKALHRLKREVADSKDVVVVKVESGDSPARKRYLSFEEQMNRNNTMRTKAYKRAASSTEKPWDGGWHNYKRNTGAPATPDRNGEYPFIRGTVFKPPSPGNTQWLPQQYGPQGNQQRARSQPVFQFGNSPPYQQLPQVQTFNQNYPRAGFRPPGFQSTPCPLGPPPQGFQGRQNQPTTFPQHQGPAPTGTYQQENNSSPHQNFPNGVVPNQNYTSMNQGPPINMRPGPVQQGYSEPPSQQQQGFNQVPPQQGYQGPPLQHQCQQVNKGPPQQQGYQPINQGPPHQQQQGYQPINQGPPQQPGFQPTNQGPPQQPGIQPSNQGPPQQPGFQPTNQGPPQQPGFQPTNQGPPQQPGFQPTNQGPPQQPGFQHSNQGPPQQPGFQPTHHGPPQQPGFQPTSQGPPQQGYQPIKQGPPSQQLHGYQSPPHQQQGYQSPPHQQLGYQSPPHQQSGYQPPPHQQGYQSPPHQQQGYQSPPHQVFQPPHQQASTNIFQPIPPPPPPPPPPLQPQCYQPPPPHQQGYQSPPQGDYQIVNQGPSQLRQGYQNVNQGQPQPQGGYQPVNNAPSRPGYQPLKKGTPPLNKVPFQPQNYPNQRSQPVNCQQNFPGQRGFQSNHRPPPPNQGGPGSQPNCYQPRIPFNPGFVSSPPPTQLQYRQNTPPFTRNTVPPTFPSFQSRPVFSNIQNSQPPLQYMNGNTSFRATSPFRTGPTSP